MPYTATVGQILVNRALPPDLRDHSRVLDKKGLEELAQKLVERGPDVYRDVTRRLNQVGKKVAYRAGGFSFGAGALAPSKVAQRARAEIEAEIDRIESDESLDDDERERRVLAAVGRRTASLVDDVYREARESKNPLALQVMSGARGKPFNINSLIGFDGQYVDHKGELVPVPILSNYADGLSPAEYFAGAYGARKGVIDTKKCLAVGTEIRMADGSTKVIELIRPGDVVLGADRSGRTFPTVVLRVYDNGPRECLRYRFRVGQTDRFATVDATPDHRILARLKLGKPGTTYGHRSIYTPTMLPLSMARKDFSAVPAGAYTGPGTTQPFATLLGLLLGDGCTTRPSRLTISCADPALLADVDPLAEVAIPGVKGRQLSQLLASLPSAKENKGSDWAFQHRTPLGALPTHDIEVDHPDHMFVLANGLIVSNSTADAGFFGKQLVQAAHRLVVTAKDADEDDEFAADRGLPADVDDGDNEGALLSREVGGYPRNTVLTPRVLADLKARGHGRILVRSPLVGGPPDGGVYARDVGVREKGAMSPIGDFVGIAAAQAIAEKMSQSMLGSKHSGGVAGAEKATGGFGLLNAMVQAPKVFPGGGTVAELDGNVARIEDAPQGGRYVYVGDRPHYVPPSNEAVVKVGDVVEAGDSLDDGIPSPAKVVEHKGLGEGRRYFLKAFGKAYANSGMKAHRRNLELVTRGLLNHVELTEELEDSPYVPGDVVPYDLVAKAYQPRDGSQHVTPAAAVGRYLERPVLHHTIGTRIRPSMIKELDEFGIRNLYVHDRPPPFRATMVRGMANLQHDPDWMTRQLGSGLKRPFLDAAARGFSSDESGTSFVPAMANRPSFGRQGKTQGWAPPAPGGKSLLATPRPPDFKPPAPTA